MFGDIEAVSYIEGQNEKIAGILNELSSVFNGGEINPASEIEGSNESGLSLSGGTFVTDSKVHAELASKLDSIYSGSAEQYIEGGNNMSKEVGVLSAMGKGLQGAKAEIDNMSLAIQERITLVNGLKEYIHKGFEKLYDIASKDQEDQTATRALKEVQDKLFDELDRQIKSLHNLLKIKVQPIENDIVDFLKKNQDFTKLAETLGVQYGNEEASDRLAIVFTNMSELGLLSKKINNALKEIKLSMEEYKKIKNMDDLNDKILKIFKSLNKEEMKEKLPNILDAIKLLQNNQTIHSDIVKCLESKDCMIKTQIKAAGEHESLDSESDSDSSSDEEEVSGGDYKLEVGRSKKASLKSSLSKRLQTYQKSLKELYKNFMRQINSQFKEMGILIDLLSQEIGSNISYDEDLQKFIEMFKGFNEDIDNEKIFYSLIDLDNSVAGTALKTRFNDNLDKIIKACEGLHNYKIFKDLTNVLKKLKELIDIFADTVNKIKKVESEKQGAADTTGSSEFVWTDKLVEQSFSMNNIKLIKNSIKKLAFYGKISMIKDNLNRMNKEQKLYQEDYNKLLGKSIGLKLNEINREYVENLDRLKDKTRGRGKLLEEFNKGKPDNQKLPRGLIENIYKLQFEAKSGLYRTLESIDLYLMNFTENLTAHPEAVMELNQMLEQTNIIAKWFTQKSVDNITELLDSNIKSDSTDADDLKDFMETYNIPAFLQNEPLNKATGNVADRIRTAYEQTKKSIDSISVLKNIISMFVHIGETYGKINLTDKLYMSPNMIYKNLVKYIWVSAFTMGYGTGGGDYSSPNNDSTSKGQYEPEKGDFDSFFNILFTTVIMPLDLFKEVETIVQQDISNLSKNTNTPAYDALQNIKKRLQKDIFIIDDKYFILALKSMVGKIFTVIDTHSLLKTPDTLANIMKNPVRMIIGAAEPDVIPEAIELYVRLPLLVEFYKQIFEDGNRKYKNNEDKDNELEIIAYIPELGTVWSGLIQCIFDDSKYIKDGLYSINNIKDIINEVNKIYNSYKNKTDKDKIVRTIVLDLIAEINRRYGILKKKDIAEFYQVKKKYIKNITDSKLEDNVSYDILDESVEYERAGPSSQYIEASFSKESDESLVFSDIKLVRDFRNNIYNELFANEEEIKDLSNKSFKEKIKYYKRQIASSESKETKFELIASAIDQSSNINAYNTDVYILYYEFVISTMQDLEQLYNYIHTTNTRLGNIQTPLNLLIELYKSYNDGNIFKVKMITGNKFIIDYHSLQAHVESYIENIKYMISKFRNIICKDTIKDIENRLFELENLLLNVIIKDDQSAEQYAENKDITFESVNQQNISKLANLDVNLSDLYKHILFTSSTFDDVASPVKNNSQLLMDVHQKYDATRRSWELKNSIRYYNYITPLNNIENNDSFKNKSIVQKFNMLLFAYLNQFYNSSTKKFYGKLIDEFANKTSSAAIFELGGIPDLVDINNNPTVEPPAFNTNYALVNTNIPLSMTNVIILRTLLTRTLNVQLPVKYHLVDNLAEVSSVQLEKYRAYLPVFVTYFEHLIDECNMYKQLLDNTSVNIANFTNEPTAPTNNINISLFDDFGKQISYTTKFNDQTDANVDTYKRSFHEMLNNVINSARSLINDASNVLIELNYVPQYGNIRENFIKNFYNNNKELPFMPVSMMNFQSKSMLPIYPINSDEYKFIYGTNYVYNNKNANKSEDINSYLWLKEQVKAYNNSALSTNVLDVKQINAVLTSKYQFNHFYNLSNNVKNNLYYRMWGDDDDAVENKYSDIMNINIYNNNNLNTLVNLMENKLYESKKSQLIKSILDNCGAVDPALNNYNLDRKKARILNIIDLNVNPINIHALMREVPLVNIYNYAFTFDNIVKSFIYNINPDELYKQANLISGDKAPLALLSCLLQDPYVINYKSVDKTSANPLLDSLNKILTISYQPTEYKQQNTLYLAPPKYTTNLFESLSNSTSSKITTNPTLYHNNKFLRNILFLVNLQRVIRLKIKSAVYRINSNIVSDTNILNMRITDYTVPNDTSIKEDEFEISDLL